MNSKLKAFLLSSVLGVVSTLAVGVGLTYSPGAKAFVNPFIPRTCNGVVCCTDVINSVCWLEVR